MKILWNLFEALGLLIVWIITLKSCQELGWNPWGGVIVTAIFLFAIGMANKKV